MLRLVDYLYILTYVFLLFGLYRMVTTWFSALVDYHFDMLYRKTERPSVLPMILSLLPIILSLLNPKETHAQENCDQSEVGSKESGSAGS